MWELRSLGVLAIAGVAGNSEIQDATMISHFINRREENLQPAVCLAMSWPRHSM
jgi:hypothetical protein